MTTSALPKGDRLKKETNGMLTKTEEIIAGADEYKRFNKWRNYFLLKMISINVGMVLSFNIIAITAPTFTAKILLPQALLNFGAVFALVIIASVVLSAVYYNYRIGKEMLVLEESLRELTHHA